MTRQEKYSPLTDAILKSYKTTGSYQQTARQIIVEHKLEEVGDDWFRKHVSDVVKNPNKFRYKDGLVTPHRARVLLFDIETAPLRAYIWSKWQKGVGDNQIISDWFMLSWSAKWLFEEDVLSMRLTSEEVLNEDDKRITKGIWDLLNEADIVIAHNGIKFDIKKVNTRFFFHNLNLPTPYQTIDTLLHARKRMAISSNRLDYIAQKLGLKGKIDTGGFGLWERCMKGDDQALEDMRIYCDQDVRVLEDVYLKLRPYIQPHPNMGLHVDENVTSCHACGSTELHWEGEYVTPANAYAAYRCNDCGSIGRSRKSSVTALKKQYLVVPTPR